MSQLHFDPRTFANILNELRGIKDVLRLKKFTAVYDTVLLDITAAATQQTGDSAVFKYDTEISEIEVSPDRYDAGDSYYFVIGGNEHPPKATPFYAHGSGTVGLSRTHTFEGNLPIQIEDKPIKILWNNAAAQAKKVSVTFKRFVRQNEKA